MMLSAFIVPMTASAEGSYVDIIDEVDFKFSSKVVGPGEDPATIPNWASAKLQVYWSDRTQDNYTINDKTIYANGSEIKLEVGDYFEFALPEQIYIGNVSTFPLVDDEGDIVANCSINKNTRVISGTFTDYVTEKTNVYGYFYIDCSLYFDNVISGEVRDFSINLDGIAYNYSFSVIERPVGGNSKWGNVTIINNTPYVYWTVYFNVENGLPKYDLKDIVLTDTLQEGQIFDDYSKSHVTARSAVELAQDSNLISPVDIDLTGKTSFTDTTMTINFGNIGKVMVRVNYFARITDYTLSNFKNNASINGFTVEGVEYSSVLNASVSRASAGGGAWGDLVPPPTPSPSPSPSESPSPSPSPSPSESPSPSPSPSPSESPSPTPPPRPSITPSPSPSVSIEPSEEPSPTVDIEESDPPLAGPSTTPSPSESVSPSEDIQIEESPIPLSPGNKDIPKTGDSHNSNIYLIFGATGVIGCFGVSIALLKKKR